MCAPRAQHGRVPILFTSKLPRMDEASVHNTVSKMALAPFLPNYPSLGVN